MLLLAALMNVPTQTRAALATQLAVGGPGSGPGTACPNCPACAASSTTAAWSRQAWVWNLALPLLAALWLAGAALGLSRSVSGALDAAAVGALLLVTVGLHNAWDVTLRLVRRTPS